MPHFHDLQMPFFPGLLMETRLKNTIQCDECVTHVVENVGPYSRKGPIPELTVVCSCCSGLFPDTEEVGEGAERTRSRGHYCSHSREQEWFRRHQVSFHSSKETASRLHGDHILYILDACIVLKHEPLSCGQKRPFSVLLHHLPPQSLRSQLWLLFYCITSL